MDALNMRGVMGRYVKLVFIISGLGWTCRRFFSFPLFLIPLLPPVLWLRQNSPLKLIFTWHLLYYVSSTLACLILRQYAPINNWWKHFNLPSIHVNNLSVVFSITSMLAFFFVLLSSSLNPLIYCWWYREVRQIMKETLKKIFRT